MDAAKLALRLAEVAAWVSFRWPALSVRGALWSEELRPTNFPAHGTQPKEHGVGIINELLASPARGSAAVEHIVRRRRELLVEAGLEVPSRPRRLSPG